jgi:hypothetical protein
MRENQFEEFFPFDFSEANFTGGAVAVSESYVT